MAKWYMVVGAGCWGRAQTIKKAREIAKANQPRLFKRRKWTDSVYECAPDAYADGLSVVGVKRKLS